MPEPLSIATATIGTTLGVLGFVVGTLSNLNRTKRSMVDFRERLQLLIRSLEACKTKIQDLDVLWGYDEGDEIFFRHIWGKQFKRINNERQNVSQHVRSVDRYVASFVGITYDEVRAWTDDPSEKPGRIWLLCKRFRFSVFSEDTLRAKIRDLEQSVTNLSKLYEARQEKLLGDNPGQHVRPTHVRQLRDLDKLGSALWELRSGAARRFSQWAIELRPLGWEGSTDLLDWERSNLRPVQLWLSFHVPAGSQGRGARDHRLKLDYNLERKPSPAAWTEMVTDEALRGRDSDENQNPQIRDECLLVNRTKSFRHLFAQDRLFDEDLLYISWQRDLGQLLVALTNWSALLWNTNWVANLCSSGIRYVRATSINSQIKEPCLHTLGHRRDHEPNGGRVEDGIPIHNEYDTCNHGDPSLKLRNLGLVLAELICAKPFRFCTTDDSKFETWSHDSGSWIPVMLDEMLGMIEKKSGSVSLRETAQFCLTSEERADEELPWDGHPTFIHHYIDSVVKPIQAWAHSVQHAANHLHMNGLDNVTGIRLRRWPEDAYEVQVQAAKSIPGSWIDVQAFLVVNPTYACVGGLFCLISSLLLAWLTAGHH